MFEHLVRIFSVDTPVHALDSPTDSPGCVPVLNPWVFLLPEALLLFGKTLTPIVLIQEFYMFSSRTSFCIKLYPFEALCLG